MSAAQQANTIRDIREQISRRATALAGVPRILRAVWATDPRLTLALFSLAVLHGAQPAVGLWINKLLIDAVVTTVRARLSGVPAAAAVPASVPVGALVEWLGLGGIPGAASVLPLIVLSVLVALANNVLEPAGTYVLSQLGERFSHAVQTRILAKANSFRDVAHFENPAYYDALRRAEHSDTASKPLSVLGGIIAIFRSTVQLVSMLAVLARFSPLVAGAAVLLALPNLYVQFSSQYESYGIARWNIVEPRYMRYFVDVITSKVTAAELRIFGLGDHFLQRYVDTFERYFARFAVSRRRYLRLELASAALTSLGFTALYTFFALAALFRRISLGDMTLYSGATLQAHQRIMDLVRQLGTLYGDVLFVGQLFEFLDTEPTMAVREHARPAPAPLRQGIELRDVTFTYPGTERPVLENLSLSIQPGECVALVGENGAGKTTLVKLLGRLYDPTEGQILIDGVDLRDLDLDDWRRQLAAIFQDYGRYHLAAKTNIGLGDLARIDDMRDIERAAARGGATAVIEKLERGYDTLLGRWLGTGGGTVMTEGAELSGGEWQKVALSRAFMRSGADPDPDGEDLDEPIGANGSATMDGTGAQLLILDEPTASLDTQSEYDVYLRFHELTRGKATLLISHRFSTVRMADRIIVLEHGRIIEDGTHEALIAHGGTYAELYEKQAARYR